MTLATHAPAARRCAAVVAVLVAATALAACGSSSSSSSDAAVSLNTPAQVLAAAQKEGSVVVYTPFPDSIEQPLNAAFAKKYGIKVTSTRLIAGAFDARVQSEMQAGQHVADVILNGDMSADEAWQSKGWIQRVPQSALSSLNGWPSADWNGYFADVQNTFLGILYNTKVLTPTQYPQTWSSLLSPSLKGKIELLDPRAGVSNQVFYEVLLKAYGPDFLKKLRAQGEFAASGLPGVQAVYSGAADAFVPGSQPFYTIGKGVHAPVGIVYPKPTAGNDIQAAVPTGAPHPAAAILFLDFMISPAGQAIINAGGYSARSDVPGVKVIPSYVQPTNIAATVANANKIIQLMTG